MVESELPLSIRRQCELLGISRSELYYQPVEPDAEELALMRRIDELHLEMPFFGSRKLTQVLKIEGRERRNGRRGLAGAGRRWDGRGWADRHVGAADDRRAER